MVDGSGERSGGPFALRRATAGDAEAVARVHTKSRAEAMPWLAVVHGEAETVAYFRDVVLARGDAWVATDGDAVLGFAAVADGILEHLYVVPGAQRRGVGSALLARAKESCPGGFRFYVFQRNDEARRFYERHGCRLVSTADGRDNEEREPDALYAWP